MAFGGIPPPFVSLYPVKSVLSIHFIILSWANNSVFSRYSVPCALTYLLGLGGQVLFVVQCLDLASHFSYFTISSEFLCSCFVLGSTEHLQSTSLSPQGVPFSSVHVWNHTSSSVCVLCRPVWYCSSSQSCSAPSLLLLMLSVGVLWLCAWVLGGEQGRLMFC